MKTVYLVHGTKEQLESLASSRAGESIFCPPATIIPTAGSLSDVVRVPYDLDSVLDVNGNEPQGLSAFM
jgi:hypothetical protein